MYDICCIGHITSDKVINGEVISYQPGGTAWYFSSAMQHLPVNYLLITALGEKEKHYVSELNDKGINVLIQPSVHTVYFENIYGDNPDDRTQNVLHKADAFMMNELEDVDAKIFHTASPPATHQIENLTWSTPLFHLFFVVMTTQA